HAISVSFGGVHAVVDVDLEVPDGKLVGLIGPNGAGKTTFVDAITGFVRARGRVELGGRDVSPLAPHPRARRRPGRAWQAGELFDDLNVGENLAVAERTQSVWATAREVLWPATADDGAVRSALTLVDLEGAMGKLPSELSQGERKLTGVARALMSEPRVV